MASLVVVTLANVAARPDTRMTTTYRELAKHLLEGRNARATQQAHWVCIAGGPGSGKSTLATAVAQIVNECAGSEVCCVLPMDGFHYSRADLKALDPPDAASYLPRRGSPWTFNAESCYESFAAAKANGEASLPTYSRELSDPVPDGVRLERHHELVLIEGNYLLGAVGEESRWAPLASLWDEKWFIRCADAKDQRERLIARHLETWNDEKSARWGAGAVGAAARADANDVLNMDLISPMEILADRVIESV